MYDFFNPYYWSIAFGTLTLGDIVVIPAIYLAISGVLDFVTIILIVFFVNTISDAIWYYIGWFIPKKKLENSFLFRNRKENLRNPSPAFKKNGMKILFYSKFIYGIRPFVRVLCGVYRFSFKEYMAINVVTSMIWIGLVSVIALFLDVSLESLKKIVLGGEIVFTVFIILIIVFELWAKGFLKKKLGTALDFQDAEEGDS